MKKTLLVLALLLVVAAASFLTLGDGSDSGVHNSDTSNNFTVSDEEIAQITQAPSLTQVISNASANYDAKAAYAKGDYETTDGQARAGADGRGDGLPPHPDLAGREDVVHQVVAGGDVVEHARDIGGVLRERRALIHDQYSTTEGPAPATPGG